MLSKVPLTPYGMTMGATLKTIKFYRLYTGNSAKLQIYGFLDGFGVFILRFWWFCSQIKDSEGFALRIRTEALSSIE